MYDQAKDTVFKKQIRIRPEQLQYLKLLSIAKTAAGALDIIINQYKAREAAAAGQVSSVPGEPVEVRND